MQIMRDADLLACEDSRVSRKLLSRFGLQRRLVSYHEHNAESMRPKLLRALAEGKSVALISDAGTPLVSDPGLKLVQAAIAAGVEVTAIPGPSALLAALVVSGLPSDRFLFAGFLSHRRAARRRALLELARVPATLIFYEAPPRLAASLADMAEILGGERPCSLSRELTKRFEETRRGNLADLARSLSEGPPPKGEVVVVVAPPSAAAVQQDKALEAGSLDDLLREALGKESLKDAVGQVARLTGRPRREVYARALLLSKGGVRA